MLQEVNEDWSAPRELEDLVVVTGASRGIGRATGRGIAGRGWYSNRACET